MVRPRVPRPPIGLLVAFPYIAIYLFSRLGVPALLQHGGTCVWGWCSPTPSGWICLITFWIVVAWLLAWAIARLCRGEARDRRGQRCGRADER
jgi:hypothetical protein